MWARLSRSALLLFLTASAAVLSGLAEDAAELASNDATDSTSEEVDEAEFMRVSLLQGPVRLDPSQRTLLVADLGQKVSTAIDAGGGMEGAVSGHFKTGVRETAFVPPVPLEATLADDSSDEDGAEGPAAVASLMQTDLELKATKLQNTSLLAVPEQGRGNLAGGCGPGLTSLGTHIQLETLRAVGYLPQRPRCMPESSTAVSLLDIAHTNYFYSLSSRAIERLILLGYVTIYFLCVWYMWYRMVHPSKLGERPVHYQNGRKVITELDVEEETWRTSLTGWLACSWASLWVAKWGHSLDAALTKIKADDLPQIGTREYQARECAGTFKKLWEEETKQNGEEKAAIFPIVIALWSKRLMIQLMLSVACQQTLTQLYGVLLTEKGLTYFAWLQKEKEAHPDKDFPLAIPMLCIIALFSAMPIVTVIISSISNNMARRMDQKLSGALCIALFEKAQRLPSTCLRSTLVMDKETGKEVERPPEVDLMQLITYDVNANIAGSYTQIAICCNSLIATVVFTCCLWVRLRWATLLAFGISIPAIVFLAYVSQKMAVIGYTLQAVSDHRVRTLRELLWGMKIVKSYAWEDDAETRITDARKREMTILETYWYCIGVLMGAALTFPRLMIIGALWGYCEMYGTHDVANIFVSMQLLGMLKAACDGLAAALSRAILLQPSLQRVEAFLKMQEAPFLLPDRKPDWVDMWTEDQADTETKLELKGSFTWRAGGPAVLHDIDLSIKKGEIVAVVGKVGCGKSTLLQVILGELHPVSSKDARLSRPEIIAYCSQVAHIGEGTLRENVLFGQQFDASRYDEALAGASLEGDLKVLPGGDEVCIGSRGITLSGGQKARVAMARAAFHQGSEVVLVDDPFGAVDAPTAMTLLNKLLLGPLMKGRTRLVVLQPDAERLRLFDRVVILEDGRVLEQGTPEEVMKTHAFESLLSSTSRRFESGGGEEALAVCRGEAAASPSSRKEDNRGMRVQLREEDFEGRPTFDMLRQYCRIGRWRNLWNASMLYSIQVFVWLLADLVLANWTNAIAAEGVVHDRAYITAYIFWTLTGSFIWLITWRFGMWFTLRISHKILGMMLSKLLRAPIDKFFDKHPVGRIMNRMVADVATVDFSLYLRTTGTIAVIYGTLIPLMYIHFIIPWFVTLLAVPVYYLIFTLCHRYWNTTVPLRYCATNSRSEVNNLIAEVCSNNVVIRAFGGQERQTQDLADHMDDMLKAFFYGERILRRWLVNRVLFLWSFYMTSVYMVGIFNTQWMGAGTLGLCLGSLILLEALIEPNLDHATGVQLEFIALARIHEYMNIPQEKPRRLEGDSKYESFVIRIERATFGNLTSTGEGSKVQVLRNGSPVLEAASTGKGLVALKSSSLQELCPENYQLGKAEAWHQIVGVNEAFRDLDNLVEELCSGKSAQVCLEVQSGWLVDGARVVVEQLKAGYADIPRDILKGINVTFEPRTKVAITGTTGCGKSSLLLVMLRLLEPRAGRVLLNGVDTRQVGLTTLRQSLGLVPQDPVLFSGSLKKNLDPFGSYPDSRLWKALSLAHLSDLVSSWSSKLHFQVAEEGSNLSFGQRQLICLARMVLRQPALLLLDEATSAIDPRTQEEVQNTIVTAFPNSTLVAVAHRLETILDFDYVCVMERGEVIEQGNVEEVSQRRGGRLRSMLEAKRSW